MSRATELLAVLREGDSLAVVCHDNPDPDSLAGAMALERIADEADLPRVDVVYGGSISHQQNRAFVNLFDLELSKFDADRIDEYELLAFVDHSVPGANNGVPPGTPVDVVIDHHPAENVQARFVDRREDVGASATILTEYLDELGIDPEKRLATALTFAIRRETLGFLRGVTAAEYAAAEFLHPAVDPDLLGRLADPPVTAATVDAIGDAIDNRVVRNACLVTHVGTTTERDALPQAADFLVNLEGVSTAVVSAVVGDTVQVSARTTSDRIDVGAVLGSAFGDVGSAGGHDDMAGGSVPLGLFADWTADGDAGMDDLLSQLIARRVFDAMGLTERESVEE